MGDNVRDTILTLWCWPISSRYCRYGWYCWYFTQYCRYWY